jgi:hypothetical protein
MDPTVVAIATQIAILAGKKAVEAIGKEVGESGWGLGVKILDKARSVLRRNSDEAADGMEAVEASAEVSDKQVEELAKVLAENLAPAKKDTAELEKLLADAAKDDELGSVLAGDDVSRITNNVTQTVIGDNNTVIGTVGGDVNRGGTS